MDKDLVIYLSLCNMMETLLAALEDKELQERERINYEVLLLEVNKLLDGYEKNIIETPTTIERPPWLKHQT